MSKRDREHYSFHFFRRITHVESGHWSLYFCLPEEDTERRKDELKLSGSYIIGEGVKYERDCVS